MPKICSVLDCWGKHWSKGYCRKHYNRVVKHGRTDRYEIQKPICKIDGCELVGSIVGLCKKHYDIERHKNKPLSAEADHQHHIKYRYGISIEEYKEKLKEQAYVCAICCEGETTVINGKINRLAVDHCHNSNKVRGLLCRNCNMILGAAKDNIQHLKDAIIYLEKYNGRSC